MEFKGSCDKCGSDIPANTLFLYTRGIGKTRYYCKSCGIKKGYSSDEFDTFRPDASSFIDYDDNLIYNVYLLK